MKLTSSDHEKKLQELEEELEFQKQRFTRATTQATEAIQQDLSIFNWIRTYPLQSAAVIFAGGLLLSHMLPPHKHPPVPPSH